MGLYQGHLGADADSGANELPSLLLFAGWTQHMAMWAGWTAEIPGTQRYSKGRAALSVEKGKTAVRKWT